MLCSVMVCGRSLTVLALAVAEGDAPGLQTVSSAPPSVTVEELSGQELRGGMGRDFSEERQRHGRVVAETAMTRVSAKRYMDRTIQSDQ